ncbi:MAG: feruloyl esterase [Gammaproteobacteria bacterium]|nr:feruloyl esterase [Gammaproteobacteria bacterium]MBT8445371.1 feruloyl esterase [Gammaproteobacteria bacterium]NND37793.1 feruloyl esterase [Gammaproteobacteria bacterium]
MPKFAAAGVLVLGIFASTAPANDQDPDRLESLNVDGVVRQWRMYVPPSYETDTPMPLVIDLHGTGSNPHGEARLTGFEGLAAEEGFLVASPAAKYPRDEDGRLTWNVDLHSHAADDVQFIRMLISSISGRFAVDPTRIYATGMSGGARMSSRLACNLSDSIAAIGPVAGVRYPKDCKPSRPVPVIAFHGKEDGVNTYEHNADSPGYWRMGVEEAVRRWAESNQCADLPTEERIAPAVTRISYRACSQEAAIVFYRSEDAGHTWPGSPLADVLAEAGLGKTDRDIPATRLIWEFFERHALP